LFQKALADFGRVTVWSSGTGTNLKVGALVRRESGGHRYFGSKSTISRFDERFRDGQYSLVSFLFAVLLHMVLPRAQPFVKNGGTCPRSPWSRRYWCGRNVGIIIY